jgi:hypothetical protein
MIRRVRRPSPISQGLCSRRLDKSTTLADSEADYRPGIPKRQQHDLTCPGATAIGREFYPVHKVVFECR